MRSDWEWDEGFSQRRKERKDDDFNHEGTEKSVMKFAWVYCSLLVIFVFQGCADLNQGQGGSDGASDASYRRRTREFEAKKAVKEAVTDFERASYGIFSASSYSLYYPGLDFEVGKLVAEKHGVKHIKGTSDAIVSDAHRNFNLAAFYFASEYNRQKVKLLKISGKL
ncbi:MAG: hypothetical protein QM496_18405 [Verrucomicrobiota bacterium]